jgi:hypothetical protein
MYDTAIISPDGLYRYFLTREGLVGDPFSMMVFIMLNPSTADAKVDDPTIRRCKGFASREGCGSLGVVNLFGLRATNPDALFEAGDPYDPENFKHWEMAFGHATKIVAAWGAHPTVNQKAEKAMLYLKASGIKLWCLGQTKSGCPRHPLYVRSDQPLIPFHL